MTTQERILELRHALNRIHAERSEYIKTQHELIDKHYGPLLAMVEYPSEKYTNLKEERQAKKDEIAKKAFEYTKDTQLLVDELRGLER